MNSRVEEKVKELVRLLYQRHVDTGDTLARKAAWTIEDLQRDLALRSTEQVGVPREPSLAMRKAALECFESSGIFDAYSVWEAMLSAHQRDSATNPPPGAPHGLLSAAPEGCKHKGKIVSGYKKNYAIAWCDECGQITDCSDGLIPDKAVGRDDHALWSAKHIAAFGCQREADGPSKLDSGKRCASWCGHHYCPTSPLSVAQPRKAKS